MRKGVLAILMMSAVSTVIASDGRPEISICQSSDPEHVEDPILTRKEESRTLVARLSHQNECVMKNFDLLTQEIDNAFRKEKTLKADEVRLIFNAIDFAAEKHRLQMRKNKDKTPYISHPLGVAYNVAHYGEIKDASVIIGALLHDTMEEMQASFEEIEKHFGKQVASYVRDMTDDKKLSFSERKRLELIKASKTSKGVAEILLADKLYNVNDLLHNPPEAWSRVRIDRYYQWVQSVIDRLPSGNEAFKKEIHRTIDSYWEQQKEETSVNK